MQPVETSRFFFSAQIHWRKDKKLIIFFLFYFVETIILFKIFFRLPKCLSRDFEKVFNIKKNFSAKKFEKFFSPIFWAKSIIIFWGTILPNISKNIIGIGRRLSVTYGWNRSRALKSGFLTILNFWKELVWRFLLFFTPGFSEE